MRLATLMHDKVISVAPDDSLDKAICLMDEHNIHHLPVMSGGRLVGIVSDRDLLIAVGWKLECERRPTRDSTLAGPSRIEEIMSRPAVHMDPGNEIHTAARVMAEGKFHAMPIVTGHQLVGIITSTDILQKFIERQNFASYSPLLQAKVSKHMTVNLITVGPREYLHNAIKKMHDAQIRHLPVVVNSDLIGIVSDRDLRRACGVEMIEDEKAEATGSFYIGPTEVLEVMTRQPYTTSENATVSNAIQIMAENRIGCLPITRGSTLVGMLTDTDLLRIIATVDEVT